MSKKALCGKCTRASSASDQWGAFFFNRSTLECPESNRETKTSTACFSAREACRCTQSRWKITRNCHGYGGFWILSMSTGSSSEKCKGVCSFVPSLLLETLASLTSKDPQWLGREEGHTETYASVCWLPLAQIKNDRRWRVLMKRGGKWASPPKVSFQRSVHKAAEHESIGKRVFCCRPRWELLWGQEENRWTTCCPLPCRMNMLLWGQHSGAQTLSQRRRSLLERRMALKSREHQHHR